MEQENSNKEAENPAEVLIELQPSENVNKEGETLAEASTKPQQSKKKVSKLLKAKSKIVKKSSASNSSNAKKPKGTPQAQGKGKKKNKGILEGNNESGSKGDEDAKELNPREESRQKSVANKGHVEGQQIQKKAEKTEGLDRSQQKQKSEEKHSGPGKSLGNHKNKTRSDVKEKSEWNEKKEKLGGLIFMCSGKTKPDCFHYRIMGVSTSKKDLVLSIKRGLKLFLYDFDLRLMYGIYEASSSGGMKLEPRAFGGAFPVQVRFKVYKDCFPIPESVFKKAIKENYNEKNKFKTELTVKQVRKLSELFQPVAFHPTAQPLSPPKGIIRNREAYGLVKESWPHSEREAFVRDTYGNVDARSYPVLSRDRDPHLLYGDAVSARREELPRDLFLSEKEYRAYGLQGERRNLTPQVQIAPALDPYQRDHERECILRNTDIPLQRESVLTPSVYLPEREYQTLTLGTTRRELPSAVPSSTIAAAPTSALAAALEPYARNPYYPYKYSAASVDPYLPPSVGGRRETHLFEADHSRRRETDQVERSYSTYAADALSDYNQMLHYQGAKPETVPPPVSSRYSFAGPSLSYR